MTGLSLNPRPPIAESVGSGNSSRLSQVERDDSRSIISTSVLFPLSVLPTPTKIFVKPSEIKIFYNKQTLFNFYFQTF
jgi:hypothetical protein